MRKLLTQEQQKQIIEQYQSGKGSDTIAKDFDIHPNSVLKVLKRNGIKRRPFKRKIELCDFLNITSQYKNGASSMQIAEKYGVSNTIILKILEKEGVPRRAAEDTHRKYALREDYFNIIDTPEKAYVLGFIYADGCNQKDANTISLDINTKDIDILYKISKLIYLDNSHERVKSYSREKLYNNKIKIIQYSKLLLNSKYMCNALNELGCEPRKSLTAKFPEWLVNTELQRHFIRGYYDGDGGTQNINNKFLSKVVGTNQFICQMSDLIKNQLNINIYIEILKNNNLRRMYVSGNRQVRRFLDWLYQDSSIHLDRKYNIYQELIKHMDSK